MFSDSFSEGMLSVLLANWSLDSFSSIPDVVSAAAAGSSDVVSATQCSVSSGVCGVDT